MPVISLFFGITVFLNTRGEHNPPHIHVRYAEYTACFDIQTCELTGEFPLKQTRLVQAWIEIHREDLLANWELVQKGEQCFRITPLN